MFWKIAHLARQVPTRARVKFHQPLCRDHRRTILIQTRCATQFAMPAACRSRLDDVAVGLIEVRNKTGFFERENHRIRH
jgi:hypothetical protein